MSSSHPIFAPMLVIASVALLTGCTTESREPSPLRAFAWPTEQPPLAQRGGEGEGLPVTLALQPSPAWTALQAAPNGIERDRAAIRALAGDYRVTFHFQEVVSLRPNQGLSAPYHSWATERVFIIADTPEIISLQHQLVIRSQEKPDQAMVVKHWRQDWTWQDTRVVTFQGEGRWKAEIRDPTAVTGTWTQAVYGTEDEPRYEGAGRWHHLGQSSEWLSERGYRPLPRREKTVRKDYQVLDGTHRLVITPNGWVHWQDNYKLPLIAPAQPTATGPLAIEIGCARYERIIGWDWSPGTAEWDVETAHWKKIRAAWDKRLVDVAADSLIDVRQLGEDIDREVGDLPSAKERQPQAGR